MKKCTECKKVKSITDFYRRSNNKLLFRSECKKCSNKQNFNNSKSICGLMSKIYSSQKSMSVIRGYPLPNYTKLQLSNWIKSRPNFYDLYDNYKNSGYKTDLRPSVDRVDDYKSYTLDNIQLITWKENRLKRDSDIKNGKNNKLSLDVCQYDLNGNFIKEYYSISQASRETNLHYSNIWAACRNITKNSGGFIWKLK